MSYQGVEQGPYNVMQVRDMLRMNPAARNAMVSIDGQDWLPMAAAPGIWSQRSWLAAVLFSLFLGGLGVDRFYLGYTGLGIAKLFLGWLTFGVWPLIDFILILLRKVNDVNGLPLRP